MNSDDSEYWERQREIWAQERLREDEMLAFYQEMDDQGYRVTGKALAEKFNLSTTRTRLLIRRYVANLERERMLMEREHLRTEIMRLKKETFTSLAEQLWMDLGWLQLALHARKEK